MKLNELQRQLEYLALTCANEIELEDESGQEIQGDIVDRLMRSVNQIDEYQTTQALVISALTHYDNKQWDELQALALKASNQSEVEYANLLEGVEKYWNEVQEVMDNE